MEGLLRHYQKTGMEEVPFHALARSYESNCLSQQARILPSEQLAVVCSKLVGANLLVACPGLFDWTKKYRLGVSVDDFQMGLGLAKEN